MIKYDFFLKIPSFMEVRRVKRHEKNFALRTFMIHLRGFVALLIKVAVKKETDGTLPLSFSLRKNRDSAFSVVLSGQVELKLK